MIGKVFVNFREKGRLKYAHLPVERLRFNYELANRASESEGIERSESRVYGTIANQNAVASPSFVAAGHQRQLDVVNGEFQSERDRSVPRLMERSMQCGVVNRHGGRSHFVGSGPITFE